MSLPHAFTGHPAALHVDVVGPDVPPLSSIDLQRLFAGRGLTPARRARLEHAPRVMADCGTHVAGVAMYQRTDSELRTLDIGIDPQCGCPAEEVMRTLLDGLELVALAGGCHRIVIVPPALGLIPLVRQRGYLVHGAYGAHGGPGGLDVDDAGVWIEKLLP